MVSNLRQFRQTHWDLMMISTQFVKTLSVAIGTVFIAACASNPEPVARTEQTSQQVGETFDTGSTVRVGDVSRQSAAGSVASGVDSSAANRSGTNTSGYSAASGGASSFSQGSAAADLDSLVYFDFDQSALKPATRQLLAQHAKALMNSTQVVRLEGHADELGTREYNMALGERRAKAVMNYLSSLGVPRSRMDPVSYGEEKPVVLGSGEAARAKNRRVEIVYN